MTSDHHDRGWQPADAILHRFIDGHGDGAERTTAEALLAGDGEAYARTMDYQRQNVLLQALHPRRVEDTMLPPAALNLARGLRRVRTVRRVAAGCVAAFALVGAGTLGWHAQGLVAPGASPPIVAVFPSATPPPTATTTASTATGSATTGSTATGSGSTAAPVVSPLPTSHSAGERDAPSWLGDDQPRVAVHPPNLQPIGYQLVDGRPDLTAYGPVMRFAYEPSGDEAGARLALTVAAFGADRESLATSINPQHSSLFWHSGQLLYALSGSVEPSRLVRVAEAVTAVQSPAEPDTGGQSAPAVETPAEAPELPVTPVKESAEQPKDT